MISPARFLTKQLIFCLIIGWIVPITVGGQSIFKINQYNIYYNKTFMPVGTLFTNHQFNKKWSVASYFYINATAWKSQERDPSWGEGLAGFTYSPLPGVSLGVLGGFQSNEAQVFRISPIILINKQHFSLFGAFEFGGERHRWDVMGFYSVKNFKFGAELIRYYQMYAAGPRVEFSFLRKQPVTIFYSGLWDWKNSRYASMFGIYSTFGPLRKQGT